MFRIRIEQDDRILVDEACEAAVVVLAKEISLLFSPKRYSSIIHQCHSLDKKANEMVVATVQKFLTEVPTYYDYETGEVKGDEQ